MGQHDAAPSGGRARDRWLCLPQTPEPTLTSSPILPHTGLLVGQRLSHHPDIRKVGFRDRREVVVGNDGVVFSVAK